VGLAVNRPNRRRDVVDPWTKLSESTAEQLTVGIVEAKHGVVVEEPPSGEVEPSAEIWEFDLDVGQCRMNRCQTRSEGGRVGGLGITGRVDSSPQRRHHRRRGLGVRGTDGHGDRCPEVGQLACHRVLAQECRCAVRPATDLGDDRGRLEPDDDVIGVLDHHDLVRLDAIRSRSEPSDVQRVHV